MEEECLSQEKVYWPGDGQCHRLLERGPCEKEEWLVLRGKFVTCQPRLCPCDPSHPDLCEVELRSPTCSSSPCVVGRAAAQEGHCRRGEELLVSPAGWGECGCQTSPPHLVWAGDGRCYSVYRRGPCPRGQTVRRGQDGQAECREEECGEGELRYGGECHSLAELGHRGPCPHQHLLLLHQDTLQPHCVRDVTKDQRVFDLIPSIRFGPIPGGRRKVLSRRPSSNSISRDSKYSVRQSSRQYLRWLNKYRRRRRSL